MAEVAVEDETGTSTEQEPGTGGDGFYDSEEAKHDAEQAAAEAAAEAPNGNGNGKRTLADLAAEAPNGDSSSEGDDDDGDPQPRLFGSESKVTAAVKGRKPDSSHVKFKAAAIEVTGQFHTDDVLELRMVGQLDQVSFVHKRDKSGKVVATKRVHHVSATHVEQVSLSAELLRKRLEFVAEALGVDPDELAAAQERANSEVQPDA